MERFSYKSLYHSGTKGMHWGERLYQNKDGTWTEIGKERRRIGRQRAKSGDVVGGASVDYWRARSAAGTDKERQVNWEETQKGRLAARYDEEELRIQHSTYSQQPSQAAYDVARQCGLKVKERQTSMMEDRAAVNPNYTGNNDGYSNNCFGCTLAYIMRRKGLDVNAGDIPNGASLDFRRDCIVDYDKYLQTFDVAGEYFREDNRDPETGGHKRSMTQCLEDRIKREFDDMNSPHYGYLGISRPNGMGHAMAWEYDPNSQRIIFIESQDNNVSAAINIERIGTGAVNRDVNFLVDPQIDMSQFSRFGTAGNGQYNNTFVNKNETKLKIIGREEDKYSNLYDSVNDEGYNYEVEKYAQEIFEKEYKNKSTPTIDSLSDHKREMIYDDAREKVEDMEYEEDNYADDSYYYYRDRNKLRNKIDDAVNSSSGIGSQSEYENYVSNRFSSGDAMSRWRRQTTYRNGSHARNVKSYWNRGL